MHLQFCYFLRIVLQSLIIIRSIAFFIPFCEKSELNAIVAVQDKDMGKRADEKAFANTIEEKNHEEIVLQLFTQRRRLSR